MDGNMSSVANQSGTSSMMGELLLLSRIWCIVYIVQSVSTSSISEYLNSIFACLVIVIVSVYCFAKVKVGEAITTYSHLYLVSVNHLFSFSLVCFWADFDALLMGTCPQCVSQHLFKEDRQLCKFSNKKFCKLSKGKGGTTYPLHPCLHLFLPTSAAKNDQFIYEDIFSEENTAQSVTCANETTSWIFSQYSLKSVTHLMTWVIPLGMSTVSCSINQRI